MLECIAITLVVIVSLSAVTAGIFLYYVYKDSMIQKGRYKKTN